jgi:hypothetical protein
LACVKKIRAAATVVGRLQKSRTGSLWTLDGIFRREAAVTKTVLLNSLSGVSWYQEGTPVSYTS